MRKVDLKYDNQLVEEYISDLQKQLPQYEINVNNANDFNTLLEERRNCNGCNGLSCCKNNSIGYYTSYENNGFTLRECKFKKENRVQNDKDSLIKTLYLPRNILEANLENFDTNSESRTKIYKEINEFISNYNSLEKKKGLYLYGDFSIGKTYTLACIANELAKKNISCLLIYFPDLVVDLKNAIGTPRFESLLNMLKSIDVLMLDDLGSENMTAWLRDEILGPVFNYRVLENKPVFVSSNINPDDITTHFALDKSPSNKLKAERIVSRMYALMKKVNMNDSSRYKR